MEPTTDTEVEIPEALYKALSEAGSFIPDEVHSGFGVGIHSQMR